MLDLEILAWYNLKLCRYAWNTGKQEALTLISRLKNEAKVVGIKQSRKAVQEGRALCVFLAGDADPVVTGPLEALCAQRKVPVERVPAMRDLGSACGISVGAAVAVLLR